METRYVSFAINDIKFEDLKDSRFCKATIHAFADGPNAHTHPIDNSVLVNCANTIYNVPIVGKYSRFVDDFMSHENDEIAIGVIPENTPNFPNPLIFEKQPDGRTFLVIRGIIWKKYAQKQLEVLQRDGGIKSVSVELGLTDTEEIDGKFLVHEFMFIGITILGDFVNPACKDAHININFAEQFKKDIKEYLNSDNNNEKVGETEMNDTEKEVSMSTEEQVVNNAETQQETTNFSEEQSTEQVVNNSAEGGEGCNCAEGTVECAEGSEQQVECAEESEETSKEEEKPDEDEKSEDMADEEEDKEETKEDEKSDEDEKSEEEDMSVKFAEMSARITELEEENKAYMAQIAAMSDYDELKQFKADTEAKMAQEAEMAQMSEVLNSILAKGCEMSEDTKNELMAKRADFASIDAWSNYVKASLFDTMDTDKSVTIGLPYQTSKRSNSVWDRI